MGITRQAVHKMLDRVNRKRDEKLQLLNMIGQIRKDHPTMCCRDMYYKLQPEFMGRDAFEEFCKQEGLQSKKYRNFQRTTDSKGVIRFPNLLENTKAEQLDQIWTSDITYYELKERFYYLTFIQDACSRRIVGYSVSNRLQTEETTLPALKMAIKSRGNKNLSGLILHSDGGGQYYDKEFLKLTTAYQIKNSMCVYPWENGKAERLNGIIKNNYLKHKKIENFQDLIREVDQAILMYNYEKPHIKLGRLTPMKFERKYLQLQCINGNGN